MLMHRTSSWVLDKPRRDASSMETTQTFQPRHGNPHSELLETDGALCIVDAILLRGYRLVNSEKVTRDGKWGIRLPQQSEAWVVMPFVLMTLLMSYIALDKKMVRQIVPLKADAQQASDVSQYVFSVKAREKNHLRLSPD
ncbi:hypothetical protein ACHAPQ_002171 [Fusarium lateritium]